MGLTLTPVNQRLIVVEVLADQRSSIPPFFEKRSYSDLVIELEGFGNQQRCRLDSHWVHKYNLVQQKMAMRLAGVAWPPAVE